MAFQARTRPPFRVSYSIEVSSLEVNKFVGSIFGRLIEIDRPHERLTNSSTETLTTDLKRNVYFRKKKKKKKKKQKQFGFRISESNNIKKIC